MPAPLLDPQARALIDLIAERRLPPVHLLSPADARRYYRERRGYTQEAPPPVAEVLDIAAAAGAPPLRLYRPGDAAAPHPVLVYFHGGGWTIGDLDTHDVLCRQLCLGAGIAVVLVDYRLAPEHAFPAAYDDCLAAVRHVREQAAALGVDGSRLAVGGDSAGGNLAAAVTLAMRDAGDAPALLQLLVYPAVDQRCAAPSHRSNAQGYLLTADSIRWFRANYLPDPARWTDWRASPLLAPDLSRLPPALVLTAGFDPLRDEGRLYADALSRAGNRAQLLCFERQVHGFVIMGRVLDEARTAVAVCAARLREALQRDAPAAPVCFAAQTV